MFIEQLSKNPRYFFATVIAIVLSVCLHELAHGIVAIWLGDDTPLDTGHMTLNPLVHMGPMSLVMLAIAGIAWGAMPVDPTRLRGRYGDAMVSLAGPVSNVLLATLAIVPLGLWMRFDLRHTHELSQFAYNGRYLLWIFARTNVLLAIFNMIPVPPLDGSHVLGSLLPSYGRLTAGVLR
jgi:Zn-dependent protease